MKLIWIFTLIVMLSYSCNMNYVEFKPVESKNDQFVVSEQMESIDFYKNIVNVFEVYNVNYKVENSKVFISSKLWEDKDLMWNYTSKARNQEWLKTNSNEK